MVAFGTERTCRPLSSDARWGQSGKHLLAESISPFDPNATSDQQRIVVRQKVGLSFGIMTERTEADTIGQCEIPLGPNWLFRSNCQRDFQLGHSSYKFTAVAASDPPQS
jgi:hypothetical protein